MTRRRYLLTLPFLAPLAVALALPACSDSKLEAVVRALGEGCLIDSDCDGELVCVFQRCHHECETDKDCVDLEVGPYCRLGDRPTHVCLLDDEKNCEVSSDCPGGALMACSWAAPDPSGPEICRDRCQATGDCLTDQSCFKGVCASALHEGIDDGHPLVDPAVKGEEGVTCIYDSHCLSPLACLQGTCRVACFSDRDCPADTLCTVIPECVGEETPSANGCAEIPDLAACRAEVTTTPLPPMVPGPAHCSDGAMTGDETGTDCGGACPPCTSGAGCSSGDDCTSGVCTDATCQAPTCSDGVQNGTELDVDCGSPCPAGCPTGTDCVSDGDCTAADICDASQGICIAPSCNDGVLNEMETDVDCGGPQCAACDPAESCLTPGDCTSLVCAAGTCLTAGCDDGVQNGTEADVDCGDSGSGCAPCGNGAACTGSADCASGSCSGNLCVAPNCSDGMQNGTELGVDCGGAGCSAGCALGSACVVNSDCDQATPAGCHPTNLVCTARRSVTVSVDGLGSGIVDSTPGGIACGNTCDTVVFDGDTLQLDATVGPNATFSGYGGDCTGTSPCMLTVSGGDASVTATFDSGTPGLANWTADPPGTSGLVELATDKSGHVLLGGQGGDFGCGLLTASGNFSVAKYTPGPVQLADSCVASLIDGGPGTQALVDMVADDNDDVVVLISAAAEFTLAAGMRETCTGNYGFALVRYDPSLGGTASAHTPCYGESGNALGNDPSWNLRHLPSGELLVSGELPASPSVDLGGPMLADPTNGRTFLTVYDGATLAHVETHQFGGASDQLNDVAVDPNTGHIVASMECSAAIDFGNGITTTASSALTDLCVVGFDENRMALWAYQVGSTTDPAAATQSAFLPSGDVVVVGTFGGTVDFGDGIMHASAGLQDIAVIHLDGSTGALKSPTPGSSWRAYGTPNREASPFVATVASGPLAGTIYVAGVTCSVNGIDVGGGTLPANTGTFIAKYTSFGVHAWSTSSTAPPVNCGNYEPVTDLAVTPQGAPVLLTPQPSEWGSGSISAHHLVRFNP